MVSELSSLRPVSMESNMADEHFYGRVGKSFKEMRNNIGTISNLKDFIVKHFNLPQIQVAESPNGGIVIGNLFEGIPDDIESQDHESFDNLLKLFGWIEGCVELPLGSYLTAHKIFEEIPQWENKNQEQHGHLVAEELSPWAAQQVFDEMPETQGGHKLEELKVSANVHLPSTIVLLEGGILAKKNYLTAINTDSSMEFGNCIARSKYFGFGLKEDGLPPIFVSDVLYARNFACSVSRVSRFARVDYVGVLCFDPGGVNIDYVRCFTQVFTEIYADFCYHFGALTNVPCGAFIEVVAALEAYVPGIDKLELTDANKSGEIVIFEPGESWLLLGDHVIYLSNGRVVVIEEAALRLNRWKGNIQVEASMIRDATLHGTTSEAKYSSNSDWRVEFQIFSAWIQKQDLFSIAPGIYVALLLQLLYKCEDLALLAFKDYSCVWAHLYKGYYGKHGKIGCYLFSDLDDWFLDADVHQFCNLPISEEGSIYRENSILALSTSELHAFNIIWADILLGEKLLHERPFEEMNSSAHGVSTQYLAVHLKAEENLNFETIEKLISNSIAVDHALVIVISNAIFQHWITEFDAALFSMKRKSTRLLSFDPGGECSRFNWICEACLMLISAMR